MALTALKVEELFPDTFQIEILSQNTNNQVMLTAEQVLCLMTHMFFGTIS